MALQSKPSATFSQLPGTILLHAMAHWPTTVTEAYWPFVIRHAVTLYNIAPRNDNTISPWEAFTGFPSSKTAIDCKVWVCPVYVFHKSLQDNPSTAKTWTSCCWQGVFVGLSSLHASNVALVYNPLTQHMTPQFHLTSDESFSTTTSSVSTDLDSRLDSLFTNTSDGPYTTNMTAGDTYLFPDSAPASANSTPGPSTATHPPKAYTAVPTIKAQYRPVLPSPTFCHLMAQENISAQLYHCAPPASLTLDPSEVSTLPDILPNHHVHTPPYEGALSEGAVNLPSPLAYQAALASNDTLTQLAMLIAPDREHFITAQILELKSLVANGVSLLSTKLWHFLPLLAYLMPYGVISASVHPQENFKGKNPIFAPVAHSSAMA